MIRLSAGIALLLLGTWGCSGDGAEIPTVEFGGPTGARLMNGQAKSPSEAYENAYAQLTRAHYNVHRNLDARGQNPLGAKEAMGTLIHSLQTMRSCVAADDQPSFDPYIARYLGWQKDIENGTWGGAFLTDLERTEREVKSKFSPESVKILAEFPGSAKPVPAPARNSDPTFNSEKVEVPVLKTPDGPDPNHPASRETPAASPEVLKRLHFKSWARAHDDLIAAYKDRKDCKAKYEEVVAALKQMKGEYSGEQASFLDIYVNYYADVCEKTRTFTALPEKTTEKDIQDELEVAARVLRKRFNPDK